MSIDIAHRRETSSELKLL